MAQFFVSWALWEEMTFVLAMCIVIVFCMGLFRLWWAGRESKKQEVVLQEKRERLEEMRKMGMKVKKGNASEIPFGIRAIQSGIEVDGIWISRTPTPSVEAASALRAASSVTMSARDSEAGSLGAKGKIAVDDFRSSNSTADQSKTSQRSTRISKSDVSTGGRGSKADMPDASPPLTPAMAQYMKGKPQYTPRPRPGTLLNEDTLRRLEGRSPRATPTAYDPYIPASQYAPPRDGTPSDLKRPSHRRYESSSESVSSSSSRRSQTRSLTSSNGKAYPPRQTYESKVANSIVSQESSDKALRGSVVESHQSLPRRDSNRSQPGLRSQTRSPSLGQTESVATPPPTFAPREVHVNRSARRVNAGFEVLPVGTFGLPPEYQLNGSQFDLERGLPVASGQEVDTSIFTRPQRNKLRKASPPLEQK